jgi:signal transduction histidine kinase
MGSDRTQAQGVADDRADDRADDPSLFAAVLDALPELVFVLDRDGRYVDVLGGRDDGRYHDGRSLVGQSMHNVLPRDLADGFLARIHEALDTDRVITYEYTLNAQDVEGIDSRPGVPDELWFEGRVARLPSSSGRSDRVVWMAFNVTAARVAIRQLRRQKQEREQQRVELEALAGSKERVLSIVSHDLRAPLTSIQGFLDLLSERWDELDPDQAREFVRRSRAKAVQMQQMLVDLLDASRHEHAATVPQPRDVSVADLLHDVVSGLASDDHGVVVGHADGRVHADPVHLARIAANLIDNARKYGTPPVEISAHQDGDQVHIRVRDHGGGIPDAFVAKLFTPFSQAQPTSHVEGGIGLGLSIVRQLARQNGGTVSYEPSLDGACFLVTLPAASDQRSHVE